MTTTANTPRAYAWAHTLGAVAVFVGAQLLPVPGTNEIIASAGDAGRFRFASFWIFGVVDWVPPYVPLLSSGLVPWLAFGWLVAGLALSADATDRARALARGVVLALLFGAAAIQGFAIALWLEASSMDFDAGLRSRLVVTITFAAGAAVLWLCARWIDTRGSGQGPLVLLLVHSAVAAVGALGAAGGQLRIGELGPLGALVELGSVAPFVVLGLALALRSPREWPVPLVRAVQLGSGVDLLGAQVLATTIVMGPVLALATRLPGGPVTIAIVRTVIGLAVAVALVTVVARRAEHRRRFAWLGLAVALPVVAVAWLGLATLVSAGGLPEFTRPGPFDGEGRFAIVLERASPDARADRAHEIAARDARNLERRLEDLGVTAHVSAAGPRLEVWLEDVGSPHELLRAILPPNQLAFRLVAQDQSSLDQVPLGPSMRREPDYYGGSRIVAPSPAVLDAALVGFTAAPGLELLYECSEAAVEQDGSARSECSPYLVEPPVLGNADIADASVALDQMTSRPYIALELTEHGARMFETLTARSIHRKLAIVLDGNILSSPVIQSAIAGGRAQITLGGSAGSASELMQQAQSLATSLRVGALEAEWRLASIDMLLPQ